jgi:hypothetical protein
LRGERSNGEGESGGEDGSFVHDGFFDIHISWQGNPKARSTCGRMSMHG